MLLHNFPSFIKPLHFLEKSLALLLFVKSLKLSGSFNWPTNSNWWIAFGLIFFLSLFVLHSFQYTDLSDPLLKGFDSFYSSFANKVTTGTYSFVYLIAKIILSVLASTLCQFANFRKNKMVWPSKFQLSFETNQWYLEWSSKIT